jgi:hypothetical protein
MISPVIKYVCLGIGLFLVACTSNTIYKKPEDLIPPDQMVDLLTDIYLANGAYSVTNKFGQNKVEYMPLVYEKYHIDSARFHHSNIYYMSRIDEYEAIYKEVKKRLIELKIKDSLEHHTKKIPQKQSKQRKNVKKEKK